MYKPEDIPNIKNIRIIKFIKATGGGSTSDYMSWISKKTKEFAVLNNKAEYYYPVTPDARKDWNQKLDDWL